MTDSYFCWRRHLRPSTEGSRTQKEGERSKAQAHAYHAFAQTAKTCSHVDDLWRVVKTQEEKRKERRSEASRLASTESRRPG